jgi:type I pantothenate kinase
MPALSAIARALQRRIGASRPCVIAVTGAVAVGKSTFARALRRALRHRIGGPIEIVSSDGFLISDAELIAAGALERKGHPESYRHAELAAFFAAIRAGAGEVSVPIYSHSTRGVIGRRSIVAPRALIFEGVYAVQPARASGLDCVSLFLDASATEVERSYLDRFARLHGGRFPSEAHARSRGRQLYERVNRPNFALHIAPLRDEADHVLMRGPDGVWRLVLSGRRQPGMPAS